MEFGPQLAGVEYSYYSRIGYGRKWNGYPIFPFLYSNTLIYSNIPITLYLIMNYA